MTRFKVLPQHLHECTDETCVNGSHDDSHPVVWDRKRGLQNMK
jgi:hypothetical protein